MGAQMLTDLQHEWGMNGATEQRARGQIELTDGDDFRIGEYVIGLVEARDGGIARLAAVSAALVQAAWRGPIRLAGPMT